MHADPTRTEPLRMETSPRHPKKGAAKLLGVVSPLPFDMVTGCNLGSEMGLPNKFWFFWIVRRNSFVGRVLFLLLLVARRGVASDFLHRVFVCFRTKSPRRARRAAGGKRQWQTCCVELSDLKHVCSRLV